MTQITDIFARQIFDSRGTPTVEVDVTLASGVVGRASVPSGASTGSHEAVERRDQDPEKFQGKGVQTVVDIINGEIFEALRGFEAQNQLLIDQTLRELDGTENKSRLGANATLAVSLAVAKASAHAFGRPLYEYLKGPFSTEMPVPLINVLNGGAHADNALDIQEFMIVPVMAESFSEALRMGNEIFMTLKTQLKEKGLSVNVGDEGGFAPNLSSTKEALDALMAAIEGAGYAPGDDVGIALDVAANELFKEGIYHLKGEGKTLKGEEMIAFYEELLDQYPILSIEDPLQEDDWETWRMMTEALGDYVQIVGDDLFVTNQERIDLGLELGAANAVLIKPNQIGTLSETMLTIEEAHRAGYACVISHRSGETEDTTISHIAVASGAGQIKTGSLCRTDRLAKYNELLRIEEMLQPMDTYAGPLAFPRSYMEG